MSEPHIATTDRDLNHYVIPAAKREDWTKFLDAVEQWTVGDVWPGMPPWAIATDRLDAGGLATEMSAGQ